METKVVVICIFLGVLGVLSAILGFAAEGKKIKVSELDIVVVETDLGTSIVTCSYPNKQEATGLGIAAALLLLVAKIIINIATGCFCCKMRQDTSANKRRTGLICYIFCWVTFLIAFFCLLSAAVINSHRNDISCTVVKNGVFAVGGLFSLAAVALGIICYLTLSSSDKSSWGTQQNQGVAMGQPPQFPQQQMGAYPKQQV